MEKDCSDASSNQQQQSVASMNNDQRKLGSTAGQQQQQHQPPPQVFDSPCSTPDGQAPAPHPWGILPDHLSHHTDRELSDLWAYSPSPVRANRDEMSAPVSPIPMLMPRSASAARLHYFASSPISPRRGRRLLAHTASDVADHPHNRHRQAQTQRMHNWHQTVSHSAVGSVDSPPPYGLGSPPVMLNDLPTCSGSGSSSNLIALRRRALGHSCPQLATTTIHGSRGGSIGSTTTVGDSSSLLLPTSTVGGVGVGACSSSLHPNVPVTTTSSTLSLSAAAPFNISPRLIAPPVVKFRNKELRVQRRHSHRISRRSFNPNTSPVLPPRCRSPNRMAQTAATAHGAGRSTLGVHGSASGGGSGRVPLRPSTAHALGTPFVTDTRRWSLASLPSSSGYGTPRSGSAMSRFGMSQYSSQERIAAALDDLRLTASSASRFYTFDTHMSGGGGGSGVGGGARDSSGSMLAAPGGDGTPHAQQHGANTTQLMFQHDGSHDGNVSPSLLLMQSGARPRSRSLNSPVSLERSNSTQALRNHVYKQRFPKACQQMDEKLEKFIADNGPLSGSISSMPLLQHTHEANTSKSIDIPTATEAAPTTAAPPSPHPQAHLLMDGVTRFLHHQIVELAADCLARSRQSLLSTDYFCELSENLDKTLIEAREKCAPECFTYLYSLVKQVLMVVARPARLLECLEFDPEKFYQILEQAEDHVREQLGCADARVPDLPQYIVSKLGLDRSGPLVDPDRSPPPAATPPSLSAMSTANNSMSLDQGDMSFDYVINTSEPMEASLSGSQGGAMRQPSPLPVHRPPDEKDFETLKNISNGAYGTVDLVRHIETRNRFALKRLSKATLAMRNMIEQVYAERDILMFTDNPFVVSFYGSFETKKHLCIVLEYVEGGDCASLLKNVGALPVDLTRLYIAETILAIEYLHHCGIVHRDLKPDNLLITAMGHIKLTDFGLSKIGLMNRTTLACEGMGYYVDVNETQQFQDKQVCGTPEYVAPEVILRQGGYGRPVDWWSLGVIMYEFLVGFVPFVGETPEEMFSAIVEGSFIWPDEEDGYSIPEDAKCLVNGLLQQNPIDRLGSTRSDAVELKSHPFFSNVCWNALLRQKAEFVPNLEGEDDTSYFDTRADRYNHDIESGDDDQSMRGADNDGSQSPMLSSFSSCASPRHSFLIPTDSPNPIQTLLDRKVSAQSEDSAAESGIGHDVDAPPSDRSRCGSTVDSQIPMAIILRRRFSSHRSSALGDSGSSGGGTPLQNTVSSTDSGSLDIGADASKPGSCPLEISPHQHALLQSQHQQALKMQALQHDQHSQTSQDSEHAQRPSPSQLSPAVSKDGAGARARSQTLTSTSSLASDAGSTSNMPLPRVAISIDAENDPIHQAAELLKELSPVDERIHQHVEQSPVKSPLPPDSESRGDRTPPPTEARRLSYRKHHHHHQHHQHHGVLQRSPKQLSPQTSMTGGSAASGAQQPTAPTAATTAAPPSPSSTSVVFRRERIPSRGSASSSKSNSLHLVIPSGNQSGGGAPNSAPLSSGGTSVSSTSSLTGPLLSRVLSGSAAPPPSPSNSSTSSRDASPGRNRSHGHMDMSSPVISQANAKPPITITRRGHHGFGFTLRSVRVYLGPDSEWYTIQHIATQVDADGAAHAAGLRSEDLINEVNGDTVQNMTHTQLMQKLLSSGEQVTLRVTPLSSTGIKTGAARRSVGKMARRYRKQNLRRKPLQPPHRKPSHSASNKLYRRVSAKRQSAELSQATGLLTTPGASMHKQTFIPRSVSTSDGVQLLTPGTKPAQHKRLSDVGLVQKQASSPVQTQQSDAHAKSRSRSPTPGSSTGSLVGQTSSGSSNQAAAAAASAYRPSTLQGLRNKLDKATAFTAMNLTAAGRKQSVGSQSGAGSLIPVSPLARDNSQSSEQSQTTTSTTASVQHRRSVTGPVATSGSKPAAATTTSNPPGGDTGKT